VEEEEAELLIVRSISFIQPKPQRSIVALMVLSMTVSVKEIDMTLIQETWYIILSILYCTGAKRRLRFGYTAAIFCLYLHTVFNGCKAETEMRLYCSCLLFILCILY